MRKLGRWSTLICLLLSAVILFGSCRHEPADPADSGEGETTTMPPQSEEGGEPSEPDDAIRVIENGKMLYKVVSSKTGVSNVEQEAVQKITMALNETGARMSFGDDTVYDAETMEIVIGTCVDYPEVRQVQNTLKYNDYALRKVGNKIVITAINDNALLRGATYFVKKIVAGTERVDGKANLSLAEYTSRERYSLESLTIDGIPIQEWTIVYPEDSKFSYEWAVEYWRNAIGVRTGCVLNIMDDASEPVEHAIVLGYTDEAVDVMKYRVRFSNGRLEVVSGGVYSAGLAADGLIEHAPADCKIASDFQFEGNLMTAGRMQRSAGSDIRVMSANILAELESWGGSPLDWRVEILVANIKFYQPDVVGIQETTAKWVDALNYYFANGSYRIISNFTDKGKENYSCIIYNTQTLTLRENGCRSYTESDNARCRHMGWGVFTENSTGKEFAFISTHWNLGKNMVYTQGEELWAFMQELSAGGTRSVFSVGDYNTGEQGEYYGHLMEISTLKNMKRITANLVNDIGTEKGLGSKANSATPTIDFILGTEDAACQMFMTLTGNCVEDMSDHSPLMADVSLQ